MLKRLSSLSLIFLAGVVSNCHATQDLAEPQSTLPTTNRVTKRTFAILATTDLHCNLLGYDYLKNAPANQVGLSRIATLIEGARKEFPNHILIDNGDTLQGTPLCDYHVTQQKADTIHPMIRAMNLLHYDVGVLGNHEFNYGLNYLKQAMSQANFPMLSANIFSAETHQNFTLPSTIIERKIDGKSLKIGLIGLTPPQIVNWDKRHLSGKFVTEDMVTAAKREVKKLRDQNTDLIIVAAHTGLATKSDPDNLESKENAGFQIVQIDGVDGLILGHTHTEFSSEKSPVKRESAVNLQNGTVVGKPVVLAGSWGSHLGVITFDLEKQGERWHFSNGKGELRATSGVAEAADIVSALQESHQRVLSWIEIPLGETKQPISTWFARIEDSAAVQIVNAAQTWAVQARLKGTKWEKIPVLSAAAPFRFGAKGANDYTQIPAGPLSLKSASDLYIYPNTLAAVTITGKGLRKWLERSAENFNQIDAAKATEQALLNHRFQGYNFDIIDGISYEIDVTRKVGERIENLTFNKRPLRDTDLFVVATNNYRASMSNLYGFTDSDVILTTPDESRQILIDFIKTKKMIDIKADNNWRIKPDFGKARAIFDINENVSLHSCTACKIIRRNPEKQSVTLTLDSIPKI